MEKHFIDEIPSVFFSEPANLQQYIDLYVQLKETLGDKTYDACPPQVIDTEKRLHRNPPNRKR